MLEDPATIVAAAADLIVLATAVGAVASDMWILPPTIASHKALSRLSVTIWKLLGLCLIALACTSVAGLILRTANMSDLPVWTALPAVGTVLRTTHYGQLWLWRAAALGVLVIAWAMRWRHFDSRIMPGIAFMAIVVIIFCLSASGHAGDDGLLSVVSISTSLHILGGFLWGGGVIFSAVVIFPALSSVQPSAQELIANAGLRLSTLAAIALALVLIPGLYNAWLLVGSWHALWSSIYGQLLLVKITLVGAMMTLGAINRYIYVPALQLTAHRPVPRTLLPLLRFLRLVEGAAAVVHFMRSLRVEGVLLLGVLCLAAALSQQSPPAHAEHESMRDGDTHHQTRP